MPNQVSNFGLHVHILSAPLVLFAFGLSVVFLELVSLVEAKSMWKNWVKMKRISISNPVKALITQAQDFPA
jgi:hypothetical protein